MRLATTFTPATSAWTSPMTLSGERLLRSMMPSTSRRLALAVAAGPAEEQALGEGVVGQRRQPRHRDPADVGDVDERAGEERDPAVGEDRTEDQDVVGVDAAAVRDR